MDVECDVCGTPYDESELTVATTTYAKAGEELKVTVKKYCEFCLHQDPMYVKVYGDGTNVEEDPDDDAEEDITGDDAGTTEGEEETP